MGQYFKRSNGDHARIGRFTWASVTSEMFGKYYIDVQTVFGSKNTEDVPCGEPLEVCLQWLSENGFTEQ